MCQSWRLGLLRFEQTGPGGAEWKRAQALRPDKEVQVALDKALADKKEEESYRKTRAVTSIALQRRSRAGAGAGRAATLESTFRRLNPS